MTEDIIPRVIEPEVPFTPIVQSGGGDTRNVRIGAPVQTEESSPEVELPQTPTDVKESGNTDTVREKTVTGSADRPSLQKALFTYALPVVCAWFGSIVTDLF